jgi:hypothetical protein
MASHKAESEGGDGWGQKAAGDDPTLGMGPSAGGAMSAVQATTRLRRGRPPTDPRARFMRKVRKLPSGCWRWGGPSYADGVGRFRLGDRGVPPARAGWQLFKGECLPREARLLYLCGDARCVNPEHMRPTRTRPNNRDPWGWAQVRRT